tara:strand:- start:561 stop:1712 length:1152 start_codon:yes stop_codon:yes gene_type:complete
MGLISWAVGELFGVPESAEAFQVRATKSEEPSSQNYDIQIKGRLPVYSSTDVWCAINFFDKNEDAPILSLLDVTMEENTRVFLHSVNLGIIGPDQYYPDWVKVGPFINEIILPPRTGTTEVEVRAYLYSAVKPLNFNNGYIDNRDNMLTFATNLFHINYKDKGYRDQSEDRDIARVITVNIAMQMAMADGSLDPDEGLAIKKWISGTLNTYGGKTQKDQMKSKLNAQLVKSYKAVSTKNKEYPEYSPIKIDPIIKAFNLVATKADKFTALELCLDVMAADGVAEKGELLLLKKLASDMHIEYEEISRLKDKRMMSLDSTAANSGDKESIIGLNESLSNLEKLKFIRKEFMKWNGRLHSLKTDKEKENAQKMLAILGDLRRKYE